MDSALIYVLTICTWTPK